MSPSPLQSFKAHPHVPPSDLTCICLTLGPAKNPTMWQVGDDEAKGENNGANVIL